MPIVGKHNVREQETRARQAARLHRDLPGVGDHLRRQKNAIKEARRRISENPERYFKHIYGERRQAARRLCISPVSLWTWASSPTS